MDTLRIVVVDDSKICREILRTVLEADGDIRVVGEGEDGDEALAAVKATQPHLVTMDIDMPGVDGLTAIRRIMRECPVPILVVTGRGSPQSTVMFQALELGALDLIAKRDLMGGPHAGPVRAFVRTLARTPVFLRPTPATQPPEPVVVTAPRGRRLPRLVAIAGATGGPLATLTILRSLPSGFRVPVAIAQHLPDETELAYAHFLASSTAFEVVVASDVAMAAPGRVVLAPTQKSLSCDAQAKLSARPPMGQDASANIAAFCRSVASSLGDEAAIVLLAGSVPDPVALGSELGKAGALVLVEPERDWSNRTRLSLEAAGARVLPPPLIASTLLAIAYPQEALATVPPMPLDLEGRK